MIHPNIKILTWFNFFTDFKLYTPVAVLYFAHVTNSFALGMSIFSITMISSALLEVPTGVLSDHLGRRKTLILGALSAVAYSVLYAIGQSYLVLVAGAIFEGLSRSFYSGNNDALLHDTLSETKSEDDYSDFQGRVSAMFQVALAVSAVLGGILASWSYPVIMWISVIPQVICVFLAFFIIEPKTHSKESGNIFAHIHEALKKFLQNPKLRLLSFSSILTFGLGEAGYQFQSAFFNTLWPVWALGIAKAISNTTAAMSFYFSGALIRRFGRFKILVFDNLYNRFVKIFAILFPSVASPVLISSTSAFYGVSAVAVDSLMQKEFTSTQRATMGSLNSFAGSIFFGIVAFLLGKAADVFSPAQAYLALQFFQFANLIIYWKLFRK